MSNFWVKEAVNILRQNGSRECAEAVDAFTTEGGALRANGEIAAEKLAQWDGIYRRLLDQCDALAAAARKVTCRECAGSGWARYIHGPHAEDLVPCPDCTDLRKLLEKPT